MATDEKQGRFWRWYGAGPLHLAAIVVNAAISGYALTRIVGVSRWGEILAWLGGSVLLHDFVLFPLMVLADWGLRHAVRDGPGRRIPVLNHVRIPLLLSALLLFLFFPLVLRGPASGYRLNSGLSLEPYLWRWLTVSAALLLGSAALYVLRVLRSGPAGPGREWIPAKADR